MAGAADRKVSRIFAYGKSSSMRTALVLQRGELLSLPTLDAPRSGTARP